jgi:hypothetical protein
MKKQEAITVAEQLFDHKFSEDNYTRFVSNLLKDYSSINKVREGNYIKEAFQPFVESYKIIGTFSDAGGDNLDILTVRLQKETSLERARTAQRNFVADYLKKNNKEGALVAFLSPNESDWRFSLVKLEYSLEVSEGKLKTSEDITPAKRWSFLIGDHEGSHTVKSRFLKLLQSDQEPTFAELEEAFNIEKVTNEFYEKYKELFLGLKESLDKQLEKDNHLKSDFANKEIATADFAKKTLGQMAFLYFLQKKGWFGVAPNKDWGTGAKNFLRELFSRREKYGQNFFDDVLEPLFYEALAQDRGNEAIYPRLNNCRMPFLNGGLFEPMNGYAWETTHIRLPDELFSNKNKTKEGDIGDGILDIFDRYNFTVNENEPLEKEVAVDPEMLGKVFENLLEIKDRKSKGAYYTPREIVHYMCQESLINYLDTESDNSIPRSDIEVLIRRGSQIIQNDRTVIAKHAQTKAKGYKYTGSYTFMLPESVGRNAKILDTLLANIKVCDPAVGSGAFPLGMLTEVVQARQVLGVHIGDGRTLYDLKLHTISNSIYGVDLETGAVEITKLRLWLALVVEETEPHPLPNLDHKIMQGNSLISEYEGIKLFDDSFLTDSHSKNIVGEEIDTKLLKLQQEYFALHSRGDLTEMRKIEIEKQIKSLNNQKKHLRIKKEDSPNSVMSIFDTPEIVRLAQEKTEKLQHKIKLYISESSRSQKQKLKEEIDTLKWELIEVSLAEQDQTEKLEEIKELRRKNIRPFFIWKLEFSDVFQQKGGFDIVIGNPPYIRIQDLDEQDASNLKKYYRTAKGKFDIYILFVELSFSLKSKKGEIIFIHPHRFLTAAYGEAFKSFLGEKSGLKNAILFDDHQIFETATTYTGIFEYSCNNESLKYARPNSENLHRLDWLENNYSTPKYLWNFIDGGVSHVDIFKKIINSKYTLNEFVTGVFQGVVSVGDEIFIVEFIEKIDADLVKVYSKAIDKELILERKILKPVLKGENIKRYQQPESNHLIIYPHELVNGKTKPIELDQLSKDFPNTFAYLKTFESGLTEKKIKYKTNAKYWYSLHRSRDINIFEQKKIITPQLQNKPSFCLDNAHWYPDAGGYTILAKPNIEISSLLALLNSKLLMFFIKKTSNVYNNGYYYFKTDYLKPFPIPESFLLNQGEFSEITKELLNITSVSNYDPKQVSVRQKELEAKIDEMVFDLYGLTAEEREIVLNS